MGLVSRSGAYVDPCYGHLTYNFTFQSLLFTPQGPEKPELRLGWMLCVPVCGLIVVGAVFLVRSIVSGSALQEKAAIVS